MDRELLIEIGVEELPAAWMPSLTRQLGERLTARLNELRIAPMAPVESFSTPRRLTVRVAKIAERQEDLEETVSGPPVSAAFGPDGQPTPAARRQLSAVRCFVSSEEPPAPLLLARLRTTPGWHVGGESPSGD